MAMALANWWPTGAGQIVKLRSTDGNDNGEIIAVNMAVKGSAISNRSCPSSTTNWY